MKNDTQGRFNIPNGRNHQPRYSFNRLINPNCLYFLMGSWNLSVCIKANWVSEYDRKEILLAILLFILLILIYFERFFAFFLLNIIQQLSSVLCCFELTLALQVILSKLLFVFGYHNYLKTDYLAIYLHHIIFKCIFFFLGQTTVLP